MTKAPMNGEERRKQIAAAVGAQPVTASALAERLGVSRQVIVQDVALLRAEGANILSTNRGYVSEGEKRCTRVFQVRHSDADTERELFCIADEGGRVEDVSVRHTVYGTLSARMDIGSRSQAHAFLQRIEGGGSALLKNVTSGIHFHTVSAESEKVLDEIEGKLRALGFLVEKS